MSDIGNREIFAENLKYYLDKKSITQKELCDYLGIATSTLNDWTKAKKYPRIDKIERMAEFFEIMKSDLIEKKITAENQKDNNTITRIVARMRKDSEFFSLVQLLYELDKDKIDGVKKMLSAFIK